MMITCYALNTHKWTAFIITRNCLMSIFLFPQKSFPKRVQHSFTLESPKVISISFTISLWLYIIFLMFVDTYLIPCVNIFAYKITKLDLCNWMAFDITS